MCSQWQSHTVKAQRSKSLKGQALFLDISPEWTDIESSSWCYVVTNPRVHHPAGTSWLCRSCDRVKVRLPVIIFPPNDIDLKITLKNQPRQTQQYLNLGRSWNMSLQNNTVLESSICCMEFFCEGGVLDSPSTFPQVTESFTCSWDCAATCWCYLNSRYRPRCCPLCVVARRRRRWAARHTPPRSGSAPGSWSPPCRSAWEWAELLPTTWAEDKGVQTFYNVSQREAKEHCKHWQRSAVKCLNERKMISRLCNHNNFFSLKRFFEHYKTIKIWFMYVSQYFHAIIQSKSVWNMRDVGEMTPQT